ncbi:MAG: alpha/beta hydrolase [Rhizobacter sp.]|nr:alpha/beta hydrolase [Rhizobacter sp.]
MAGPVGAIECATDEPADVVRGVALVCHPHPQFGGTMDNKVEQTVARAFLQLGYRVARFNYRGVGASEGVYDEARGEVDDAMAVIAEARATGLPLAIAGFSFGGFIAQQSFARLAASGEPAERLLLVGPSTRNLTLGTVPDDTVVIHGEADDVVPLAATLDWARPQTLPVIVVPGVGHFFHGQLPLLKTLVVRSWHR